MRLKPQGTEEKAGVMGAGERRVEEESQSRSTGPEHMGSGNGGEDSESE